MNSIGLGYKILGRHMQVTSPSFYAGRGPCKGDLNGAMLYGIFVDLDAVSKEYGENFIRLVDSIPSIGATDFINAFNDFARNNFEFENLEESGPTIEGRTDKEKMQSAVCTALGSLGLFSVNRSPEAAKHVSDSIKKNFYDYVKGFYGKKYDLCSYETDDSKISRDVHKIIDEHYRRDCDLIDEWNRRKESYNQDGYNGTGRS